MVDEKRPTQWNRREKARDGRNLCNDRDGKQTGAEMTILRKVLTWMKRGSKAPQRFLEGVRVP